MPTVLQAHLPGNYELYDPASSMPGQVICKMCWEKEGVSNADSLDTVWVSSEGRNMVWWLCKGHGDEIRSNQTGQVRFLKSVPGVVRAPRPEVGN